MSTGDRGEPIEASSGWDVYGIAFEPDPHARWREIRERTPVLDAGGGVFFVTRWADVDAVLRDPRHHAGAGVSASFGATGGLAHDVMRVWLMSLDGAPQARARGLVRRPFTPNRIEALRPLIETTTEALVAPIEAAAKDADRAEGDVHDLIASLAFPLPSAVIRTLFGIEPEEWAEQVEPWITEGEPEPEAGIVMIEGLATFFQQRLDRGDPPPGLLTWLAEPDPEHGRLSDLEIVANAVLLVTAAIDTTAGLIGNAIHCLVTRPEWLARLRAEPSRVAGAIEETLRFEPPALSCTRSAGEDLELAGVAIPAGSQLLLGLAAAGRDPARHPDPDRFDPERDPAGGLGFGGGRHFCLGAALARLEARVALERLLVRSPIEFAPVEPPVWQRRSPTVRALERLPLRVAPRASRG